MERSIASTAVTVPKRLVTPMISTSGAEPAVVAVTDPTTAPLAGASVVREAVNGGPRATVPDADRHPCSRATGSLHRTGEGTARQRASRANLAPPCRCIATDPV